MTTNYDAHLHTTVPAQVLTEFRRLAWALHPNQPHGAINKELTFALEAHIEVMRKRTQNTKNFVLHPLQKQQTEEAE